MKKHINIIWSEHKTSRLVLKENINEIERFKSEQVIFSKDFIEKLNNDKLTKLEIDTIIWKYFNKFFTRESEDSKMYLNGLECFSEDKLTLLSKYQSLVFDRRTEVITDEEANKRYLQYKEEQKELGVCKGFGKSDYPSTWSSRLERFVN